MTIGNNFYDLNAGRGYPLDDLATGLSDAGLEMPNGIVVDICLRFPVSLGKYAFLSAVHVSSTLVSLAISAADTLDSSVLNPIATLVRSNADEGRPYSLVGLYPGVGGWVVFGDLDKVQYAGAFSTARQGLLLSQPARGYADLPVSWASKILDENKLQNVVKLLAGRDLEIVRGSRTILGESRDAIVFRLTGDPNTVLPKYTGPCGARPESNNCLKPPIQAINEVTPNPTTGDIQIAFPDMSVLNMPHGLLVSTSLALPAICPVQPATGEPDQNFCDSAISDDSVPHSVGGGGGGGDGGHGHSSTGGGTSSVVLHPTYPKCVRFYSDRPTQFTVIHGSWLMQDYGTYSQVRCANTEGELNTRRRLLMVARNSIIPASLTYFNDDQYMTNVNVEMQTVVYGGSTYYDDMKMGFVLDYRQVGGLDYFTAVFLNFGTKKLIVQRMAGGVWQTPAAILDVPNLTPTRYYGLDVQVRTNDVAGRVDIRAAVTDFFTPETIYTGGVVQVLNMPGYGIDSGRFGFFGYDINGYFSHFYLNLL